MTFRLHHWIPDAVLGGCEIALLTLIKGAPGCRHIILTDRPGPAVQLWETAGAKVVFIGGWSGSPFAWAKIFRNKLQDERPQALMAWSPSRLPWLHEAASKAGVSRLLVHLGTNIPLPSKTDLLYRLLHGWFQSKCELSLVCCSEAVARGVATGPYFRRFSHTVVANGVREEFFNVAPVGSVEGRLVLGNVARLEPLKGQATLIAAMPDILRRFPEAELRLIGEGPGLDCLQNQAQALRVTDRVKFLGRRTDLPEQLAKMDIFLFSSSAQEGMGIALAEAMASGRACVVSDTQTMREVTGGCAGFFPTRDAQGLAKAVVAAAGSLENLRRMGFSARQVADNAFSPKNYAEAYLRLLKIPF